MLLHTRLPVAPPAAATVDITAGFCTADARFTWAAPHAVGPALRRLLQLAPAGAPPTAFPAVQAPLAVPPPAPVAAAPQPMATASKNLLVRGVGSSGPPAVPGWVGVSGTQRACVLVA